jgi:hypothetical protein
MINAATKKFDAKVREGLAKINIQTSEHKPYELLLTVFNILYNNHISIQKAFFYSDRDYCYFERQRCRHGIRALEDKDSEIALYFLASST